MPGPVRRFPHDFAPAKRPDTAILVRSREVTCRCGGEAHVVKLTPGPPQDAQGKRAHRAGDAEAHGRCHGCQRLYLFVPRHNERGPAKRIPDEADEGKGAKSTSPRDNRR